MKQSRPVTEAEVERKRAEVHQLEEALHIGPSERGRYATAREELGDLEARYAEQQRAAVVESITGDLDAAQARLEASRDKLAALLGEHMAALAALLTAIAEHDYAIRDAHDLLAARDLKAGPGRREGSIGDPYTGHGARIAGTDFTPVVAEAVVAHAVRQLFARAHGPGSPLGRLLEHHYRPSQVEERPDGLVLPGIPAGFTLEAPPAPQPWPAAAAIR